MRRGDESMESVCTFTGHRPKKLPWGYNEDDPRCVALKKHIYDVCEAVASAGVRRFICGMAEGCDLYFAEAVLALKKSYPDIRLEAAVPYAGQAESWSEAQQQRYAAILSLCDEKTVLRQNYSRECMMERNRYMVDKAHILIACCEGKSGGSLYTLQYALDKTKEVIQIPLEF